MSGVYPTLDWPLETLPGLTIVGRFPLDDRGHSYVYRQATHALHIHDYHGSIRINGRQFPLQPGDLTLSPAGRTSTYDLPSAGFHWCAHFNPAARKGTALRLPWHLPLGAQHPHAVERFKQVARLFALGRSGEELAKSAASVEMLGLLIWVGMLANRAPTDQPDARGELAVLKLAGILNTRFTESLTVPELADQVELTQNYLARLFKERFGMTIPRYLLARRIDHAKHLLRATNMPILRIAQRVGLPDPQYFNKQFRRIVGTSPSGFRRNTD